MTTLSIVIAFGIRLMLVLLFLPFSALDKIVNFQGAVAQARERVSSRSMAQLLILIGLTLEVSMSACILIGVFDRAAAFVLAGYCVATALLWKQFWRPGDFWLASTSVGRGLFWDFWKNVALAGGFLLLTFGQGASDVASFLQSPLESTHPYAMHGGNR